MWSTIKRFVQSYWLPILSGILVGTSYIPFPPWAMWCAFVPLWLWWLGQTSWRRIWWGGWWTQFLFTLIGFNWVAHTVAEFGHLPTPIALVTLLLFAGFANLHVPLAGLIWWFIKKKWRLSDTASLPLLAATFILCENLYPMIFDWHMGYTLLLVPLPIVQLAEWVGFRGLSALMALLNLAVLELWLRKKAGGALLKPALSLIAAFFMLNAVGWWLKDRLRPPDRTAHVLIVQANIGNLEKQEAEQGDYYRDFILDRYLSLTEKGLASGSRVDFAVWPETAFPHLLNEPYFQTQAYALKLRDFIIRHQLNLLTGGYGLNSTTREMYNSFYVINAQGNLVGEPYSKTRLLAFGEYLPGAEWFPILKTWIPEVGAFGRGQGPQVKSLGEWRFGPLICYEGLFDDMGRALARQGTQFVVNLTNDSWYGTWQEPYQHLNMTLARAIELRRPVIRATNTGISTVALADGRRLETSPLEKEWQHVYEVPYLNSPPQTLFMSAGYYFPYLLLLLLVLGSAWRARSDGSAA